jgi:hypothetical protein
MIDDLQPLIKLSHKSLDPLFDETHFITKAELKSLYAYWRKLKRVRASYKTRLTYLDKNNVPRSRTSQEASEWAHGQGMVLETQLKKLIEKFVERHPLAPFSKVTPGMPLTTLAILIASFDIKQAPTAGNFWKLAGLDPKHDFRFHTREAKQACWFMGEMLVTNNPYYKEIYTHRKIYETLKNIRGDYAELATKMVEEEKYGEKTNAYQWISGGVDPDEVRIRLYGTLSPLAKDCRAKDGKGLPMLPPIVIHFRSHRYMVKVLLAHLHYCWYMLEYGTPPPNPYILDMRRKRIEIPPQLKAVIG